MRRNPTYQEYIAKINPTLDHYNTQFYKLMDAAHQALEDKHTEIALRRYAQAANLLDKAIEDRELTTVEATELAYKYDAILDFLDQVRMERGVNRVHPDTFGRMSDLLFNEGSLGQRKNNPEDAADRLEKFLSREDPTRKLPNYYRDRLFARLWAERNYATDEERKAFLASLEMAPKNYELLLNNFRRHIKDMNNNPRDAERLNRFMESLDYDKSPKDRDRRALELELQMLESDRARSPHAASAFFNYFKDRKDMDWESYLYELRKHIGDMNNNPTTRHYTDILLHLMDAFNHVANRPEMVRRLREECERVRKMAEDDKDLSQQEKEQIRSMFGEFPPQWKNPYGSMFPMKVIVVGVLYIAAMKVWQRIKK